ncbi:MAG TPA: FAD-dependent monooxygenase [Hyphomicrobiaceae bacterium]|jgi:2-polyprenyl-6-methoxyphenol hydroxylase-like FAD-dependent oxidoreductase|nr:FAD-dependent monooxygenase [Hyphomicrobiaceae bacterium]
MSIRRALVIGGSMSGLFSALFLRRRGWEVALYERSPVPLTGRGAGIMTHPELHRAMAAVGLDTGRDFGVPIAGRVMLGAGGEAIARRLHPQIATSWNRLFEMLGSRLGAASYHLGKDLSRVSQTDGEVVAHFADGTSAAAELLVGADGLRSAVRAQHLPQVRPRYAGYVAWRGLLDERTAVLALTQDVFDQLSFHLPPGEQFLGYPVAGPGNDLRPGQRSWNVVWYRPADEAADLPRLLTDITGHTHELSIPPPLITPGVIADMRSAAERLLPPPFRAALALIEQPFLQPIYDLESPALAFGRVALVGDAAFVVRPHVGAGVVKAADDAAALAECLDGEPTVEARLRVYEAQRLPVGRLFVARARRLGCYLRYGFDSDEERARAALHANPARVLAETAVLDFLSSPSERSFR